MDYRRTAVHFTISILTSCYHYGNRDKPTVLIHQVYNLPSKTIQRNSTSFIQHLLQRRLSAAWAPSEQEWQEKLPFHRKKPWAEHGSKGGTLLLVSRGGGGQKEESNRHLEQTKLSSLGCCGVTLAFRTVQWSELVPLSYKRSNSNVPKEAVITISATLLSTYKLVNSHPPHTPNCPLSCMHFYSVNLKKKSCKRAENKSANPEQSLIFQIYFQSHYSAVTDDTLTSVC